MDAQFFKQMNHVCHQIYHSGCRKLFLYPFGYRAMEIYEFLKMRTNLEIICVDEKVSKEKNEIISFHEMLTSQALSNEPEGRGIVILTSDNPIIYTELREKVRKYVKNQVIDLFPRHPLIFHEDPRIGALAAVAENIYRQGISGSIAEAGVYRGDFSKYMNMLFSDRKLYLFDTFNGFEREQLDPEMDNEKQTDYWIDALQNTSEELVISKLVYPECAIIRKGIFPETAQGLKDNFAFVNLDMDIYKPTYEGLKFFWEQLVPGGVIFVHDFGNWDGINRAVETFCTEFHVGYLPLNDGGTVALTKTL